MIAIVSLLRPASLLMAIYYSTLALGSQEWISHLLGMGLSLKWAFSCPQAVVVCLGLGNWHWHRTQLTAICSSQHDSSFDMPLLLIQNSKLVPNLSHCENNATLGCLSANRKVVAVFINVLPHQAEM